jgi:hypothetical protein
VSLQAAAGTYSLYRFADVALCLGHPAQHEDRRPDAGEIVVLDAALRPWWVDPHS